MYITFNILGGQLRRQVEIIQRFNKLQQVFHEFSLNSISDFHRNPVSFKFQNLPINFHPLTLKNETNLGSKLRSFVTVMQIAHSKLLLWSHYVNETAFCAALLM